MMFLRLAPIAALALLSACGSADQADPSGITPGEAQALNDAATMLDANAIEFNATDNSATEAPQ
jgi:hypothetical protein